MVGRRLGGVLSIVGTCLALLLTAASAAMADGTIGRIHHPGSNGNKCLEVYNWSTANGGKVDQWSCLSMNGQPDSNQVWIAHYVATDSYGPYYLIYNKHSGKCLEDYGWSLADGARVDQWHCYGHDSNQQWYFSRPNSGSGQPYTSISGGWLVNRWSGMILSIVGNNRGNGSQAIQALSPVSDSNWNW